MVEPVRAEILYRDDAMQLVALGDTFVERWTGPGSLERLQALLDTHVRYIRSRAPNKTLMLVHLATDQLVLPDARSRSLIEQHVRAIDTHILATALVVAAQGFAAATFRAILSASILVRRSRYPHRVFQGAREATTWLAGQRTTPIADPRALASDYAELEHELDRDRDRDRGRVRGGR